MGNLIQFAGPLATIIAASAASYIAWTFGQGQLRIAKEQKGIAQQQAKLADIRLQHDLFERRFVIFEAARALILEVVRNSDVSDDGLRNFVRGTDKSVFLLEKEITDYLDDIRKKAIELQIAVARLRDPMFHPSEDRARVSAQRADLANWFFEQFDVLIEKFKPTLALDKRQLEK